MSSYLQTCTIRQIFNQINHNYPHELGISQYNTPKTCLYNLHLYQPLDFKSSILKFDINKNKTNKQPLMLYDNKKNQLKIIPSNKSYLNIHPHSHDQITSYKFGKQKKSYSYIPKQQYQNNNIGPTRYEFAKSFNALNQKVDFHSFPQINKSNFRRRIHSQEIMAKSLQTPSVGQYCIGNAPAVKTNNLLSQWPKKPLKKNIQTDKNKNKKKMSSPSPNSYNSLPRSYSLFSTLKLDQKQMLKFKVRNSAINKKVQIQRQKMKQKNGSKVGPGKYLTLNDWRQRLKDKKGDNFVYRPIVKSVYH